MRIGISLILWDITSRRQAGILEELYKMRLTDSKQLKSTMALYTQDTVQKGVEPCYTRLKDMVRRFLELKINDRNFDAWRRDRSGQGAVVKRKRRWQTSEP